MVIIKHLRMICMFTVIGNVWCFPLPTWSYKTQMAHGSHKLYCKQTHFFTIFTQLMSLNLAFLQLLCHISLNSFHTAYKHIVNLQETEVKSQETRPLNFVSKSSFCINEQVTVADTVQARTVKLLRYFVKMSARWKCAPLISWQACHTCFSPTEYLLHQSIILPRMTDCYCLSQWILIGYSLHGLKVLRSTW